MKIKHYILPTCGVFSDLSGRAEDHNTATKCITCHQRITDALIAFVNDGKEMYILLSKLHSPLSLLHLSLTLIHPPFILSSLNLSLVTPSCPKLTFRNLFQLKKLLFNPTLSPANLTTTDRPTNLTGEHLKRCFHVIKFTHISTTCIM